MFNYKLIGFAELFFGILQIIASIISPFIIFFIVSKAYPNVSNNFHFRLTGENFVFVIIFLVGFINLFLGIKCISSGKTNNLYLKLSTIFAIANFLITSAVATTVIIKVLG